MCGPLLGALMQPQQCRQQRRPVQGPLPAHWWCTNSAHSHPQKPLQPVAPQALAAQPDVVEQLVRSFAPKVIDMDGVKKGLLCQLFGGVSKRVGGWGGVVGRGASGQAKQMGAQQVAGPCGGAMWWTCKWQSMVATAQASPCHLLPLARLTLPPFSHPPSAAGQRARAGAW